MIYKTDTSKPLTHDELDQNFRESENLIGEGEPLESQGVIGSTYTQKEELTINEVSEEYNIEMYYDEYDYYASMNYADSNHRFLNNGSFGIAQVNQYIIDLFSEYDWLILDSYILWFSVDDVDKIEYQDVIDKYPELEKVWFNDEEYIIEEKYWFKEWANFMYPVKGNLAKIFNADHVPVDDFEVNVEISDMIPIFNKSTKYIKNLDGWEIDSTDLSAYETIEENAAKLLLMSDRSNRIDAKFANYNTADEVDTKIGNIEVGGTSLFTQGVDGLITAPDGDFKFQMPTGSSEGINSVAFAGSYSKGLRSFASGNANASGESAVAFSKSLSSGDFSFATNDSDATGSYSAAFGSSKSQGDRSFSLAKGNAKEQYSFSHGFESITEGKGSVGLSSGTTETTAEYSSALSSGLTKGKYSVALGRGNTAYADYSFVAGKYATNREDSIWRIGIGQDSFNKADSIYGLGDGQVIVPELSIAKIIDKRSVITKEFVEDLYTPKASEVLYAAFYDHNDAPYNINCHASSKYGIIARGFDDIEDHNIVKVFNQDGTLYFDEKLEDEDGSYVGTSIAKINEVGFLYDNGVSLLFKELTDLVTEINVSDVSGLPSLPTNEQIDVYKDKFIIYIEGIVYILDAKFSIKSELSVVEGGIHLIVDSNKIYISSSTKIDDDDVYKVYEYDMSGEMLRNIEIPIKIDNIDVKDNVVIVSDDYDLCFTDFNKTLRYDTEEEGGEAQSIAIYKNGFIAGQYDNKSIYYNFDLIKQPFPQGLPDCVSAFHIFVNDNFVIYSGNSIEGDEVSGTDIEYGTRGASYVQFKDSKLSSLVKDVVNTMDIDSSDSSDSSDSRKRFEFNGSGDTITGDDNFENSLLISTDDGKVDIFINGILLSKNDYEITSETLITFNEEISSDYEILINSF